MTANRHHHKPYDPALMRYGMPAENAIFALLDQRYQNVTPMPDGECGVDFAWTASGLLMCGDVERRHNWQAGSFPFPTCHMPLRKRKFICDQRYYWYIAVREDLRLSLWIPETVIQKAALVGQEQNRLNPRSEMFVDIPVEQGTYVELT